MNSEALSGHFWFQSYQSRQINPDYSISENAKYRKQGLSIVSIQTDQSRQWISEIASSKTFKVSIVSIQTDQSRQWYEIHQFSAICMVSIVSIQTDQSRQKNGVNYTAYQLKGFNRINPDRSIPTKAKCAWALQ